MTKTGSRRVTAVLFDLDDTLLDWSAHATGWADVVGSHMQYVHRYLESEGHILPDLDTFLQYYLDILVHSWNRAKKDWSGVSFENVLRDCFTACKVDIKQIDMTAVMHAYNWQPTPGVNLYDDTIVVLETLQQQGYKLGLVTNSMMPMWMRDIELKAYDIIRFFDARVTSGDTGYMKPHPEIYQRALALLDTKPATAVFVGDRPANDIAGANQIGMISILMKPDHLDYDNEGIQPDYTIHSLSELLPILEMLE